MTFQLGKNGFGQLHELSLSTAANGQRSWDLIKRPMEQRDNTVTLFALTDAQLEKLMLSFLSVTSTPYTAAVKPPVDEPTFTLRANDRLAPFAVMTWAKDAELHGVPVDKVVGAQKIAFDMIQWQQKHGCKVPD
jgi:hypothetical protein